MLQFVPPESFAQRHLIGLARSLLAAPADTRYDVDFIIEAVTRGTMRLFDWPNGLVLVSKRGQRLVLEGLHATQLLKDAVPLTDDLKRLAADWQCDTIETTCFDKRLTCVIEKLGGRVESRTLTLAVE
jgi:hypothetical protein